MYKDCWYKVFERKKARALLATSGAFTLTQKEFTTVRSLMTLIDSLGELKHCKGGQKHETQENFEKVVTKT